MRKPILDDGIIADTHSCALIARNGDIDWPCWPRHDSPALLTALPDDARGGRSTIRLTGMAPAKRRYRPDTAILETSIRTAWPCSPDRLQAIHPPSTPLCVINHAVRLERAADRVQPAKEVA